MLHHQKSLCSEVAISQWLEWVVAEVGAEIAGCLSHLASEEFAEAFSTDTQLLTSKSGLLISDKALHQCNSAKGNFCDSKNAMKYRSLTFL